MTEPCPLCGAPLGGRNGCHALFHEHGALAWQRPGWGATHNLLVDAYAMQHPEEYGLSVKSYAQHLVALGCGVEHASDAALYWNISRWIGSEGAPVKPALLESRGDVTIQSVPIDATDDEHRTQVQAWAAAVWEAYRPQHDLARRSLDQVRAWAAAQKRT